jgi:hypothetical protein
MMLRGQDFAPVVWMSMAILAVSLTIVLGGLSAETRRVVSLRAPTP